MEKILKILIGIALAFLIFFGLSSMFKGCGKANDETTQSIAEMTKEDVVDVSEVDEFDDDLFEEDIEYSNDNEKTVVIEEEPITIIQAPETKIEEVVEEPVYVAPKRKPTPKRTNPKPTQVGTGKYMVLAGNYLIQKNAEDTAQKLRRQGYKAEVVNFDNSKFYTVCAERCNTRSAAVKISNALKSKGIDNYIHTKN